MNKTGRKIWYGIAIFLSGLVLLISVSGIAGTWIIQNHLSTSVNLLVDNLVIVAQNIQATLHGFDQKIASMQEITSSISQASTTLSQQVASQGVVATLLPDEQITQLSDLSAAVQNSIGNIRDSLLAALSVYQTIDNLPLITLPSASQAQIDQLQQSVNTIQSTVDDLKNAISAFRAGASDQISKVSSATDQLGSRLGDVRSRLADLDTRLTNVQANLAHLRQILHTALIVGSILGSLFLAFVAYTQVEVIRLYVQRWKGPSMVEAQATTLDQPAVTGPEASPGSGPPLSDSRQ